MQAAQTFQLEFVLFAVRIVIIIIIVVVVVVIVTNESTDT